MLLPQEIESSKFKNIYEKNLPDKNVEFFWYNFKESVVNTLHSLTKETKILLTKYDIIDNLYKFSNNLNLLHLQQQHLLQHLL
jgi:hypothetical protein